MIGRVVSVKMNKTVAVLVASEVTHPLYKKSFSRTKKYLVDDQLGVKLGDIVEIQKIRPISKRKHWKVVKVVGRNIEEIVAEELKESAAEHIAEVMPEEKKVESSEEVQETVEKVQEKKGGSDRKIQKSNRKSTSKN